MKQKQSSFIKKGPAFTGVTLNVDVPVLGNVPKLVAR